MGLFLLSLRDAFMCGSHHFPAEDQAVQAGHGLQNLASSKKSFLAGPGCRRFFRPFKRGQQKGLDSISSASSSTGGYAGKQPLGCARSQMHTVPSGAGTSSSLAMTSSSVSAGTKCMSLTGYSRLNDSNKARSLPAALEPMHELAAEVPCITPHVPAPAPAAAAGAKYMQPHDDALQAPLPQPLCGSPAEGGDASAWLTAQLQQQHPMPRAGSRASLPMVHSCSYMSVADWVDMHANACTAEETNFASAGSMHLKSDLAEIVTAAGMCARTKSEPCFAAFQRMQQQRRQSQGQSRAVPGPAPQLQPQQQPQGGCGEIVAVDLPRHPTLSGGDLQLILTQVADGSNTAEGAAAAPAAGGSVVLPQAEQQQAAAQEVLLQAALQQQVAAFNAFRFSLPLPAYDDPSGTSSRELSYPATPQVRLLSPVSHLSQHRRGSGRHGRRTAPDGPAPGRGSYGGSPSPSRSGRRQERSFCGAAWEQSMYTRVSLALTVESGPVEDLLAGMSLRDVYGDSCELSHASPSSLLRHLGSGRGDAWAGAMALAAARCTTGDLSGEGAVCSHRSSPSRPQLLLQGAPQQLQPSPQQQQQQPVHLVAQISRRRIQL